MKPNPIFKKILVLVIILVLLAAGIIYCIRFFNSSSKKGHNFEATSVPHSQIPFEITSTIKLNGKKVECDKKYVSQVSNVAMITEGGVFCIEGYLEDGQIRVFNNDRDVTLILNGVDISCMNMAPIYIESAKSVTIYVPETTTNSITCAEIGTYESALEAATYAPGTTTDEASAGASDTAEIPVTKKGVIVSECNLSFSGGGTLDVFGYMRNGIHSRASLHLEDTTLNLTTTNNGIKASNDIVVESGHYDLASVGDGLQADGNLTINGGTFNITTGQGSASIEKKSEAVPTFDGTGNPPALPPDANFGASGEMPPAPPSDAGFDASGDKPEPPADANLGDSGDKSEAPADESTEDSSSSEKKEKSKKSEKLSRKAIKAEYSVVINDGSITIDSADDAIHSDGNIEINGGTIQIASSDDAVHADTSLTVKGGKLTITDCCEGIEAVNIDISDGDISVTSTDDGLNASSKKAEPKISISGGKIYINAEGDGIDSNKDLIISGGEVYVDGPSNSGNAAIDVGTEDGGSFIVNGGTLTSVGMSGMLEVPDESSKQQSLSYVFDETLYGGSIITVIDSSGKLITQLTLAKDADSITISSPDLVSGETYTFTCGDLEGTLEADVLNATNYEHRFGFGPGQGPAPGKSPDAGKDASTDASTDASADTASSADSESDN
ncbi:MAG: carbohydrate-binding domain-containing protein [Butyrivibrio sp.]|nr:carbohydrate-binding domain-containing protein [Butyrivibrio sp.]